MAQIFNFSSGPAMLPAEVLKQAQQELRDWNGLGTSVMEVSHRWQRVHSGCRGSREGFSRFFLISPPTTRYYSAMAVVAVSLLRYRSIFSVIKPPQIMLMPVTGLASAIKEAKKYCTPNVFDAKVTVDGLRAVKPMREWQLSDNAAYMHYCPNETIDGIAIDERQTSAQMWWSPLTSLQPFFPVRLTSAVMV